MTTVCAKFFNIVQADIAYFGQKDAQQAIVIQRMVRDLNLPLEIRICPIVREDDGLAMSSRNQYLSLDERERAACLHRALVACQKEIEEGIRNTSVLIAMMTDIVLQNGGQIDYVEIVNANTLEPAEAVHGRILVALAVFFGKTRLIDNLLLDLK